MATDLNHSQGETKREVITYTADETESLSEAVIVALRKAVTRTRKPADAPEQLDVGVVDPLFETVDPDALDSLFSQSAGGTRPSGTVSFIHSGFEVTARASGEILVTQA